MLFSAPAPVPREELLAELHDKLSVVKALNGKLDHARKSSHDANEHMEQLQVRGDGLGASPGQGDQTG